MCKSLCSSQAPSSGLNGKSNDDQIELTSAANQAYNSPTNSSSNYCDANDGLLASDAGVAQ
jgi:hypothetical protein